MNEKHLKEILDSLTAEQLEKLKDERTDNEKRIDKIINDVPYENKEDLLKCLRGINKIIDQLLSNHSQIYKLQKETFQLQKQKEEISSEMFSLCLRCISDPPKETVDGLRLKDERGE